MTGAQEESGSAGRHLQVSEWDDDPRAYEAALDRTDRRFARVMAKSGMNAEELCRHIQTQAQMKKES